VRSIRISNPYFLGLTLCREGEEELHLLVKVPVGVHKLRIEADAKQVARVGASHGNWQSSDSLQKYELEVRSLSLM
jgi:hypothetical protein